MRCAGLLRALPALVLAAGAGCGGGSEGEGDGFDERLTDVVGNDAQTRFEDLLKDVRIELLWYGGATLRMKLTSDVTEVAASWNGSEQCLLRIVYVPDHPGMLGACAPQWGASSPAECVGAIDGSDCEISEDRRTCVCVHDAGSLSWDLIKGKAFLPSELYVYPSTTLATLQSLYGVGVTLELPGADKPVVTYTPGQFPEDFQYLICADETLAVSWAGTDGLSELLAKQYPSHALIYSIVNVPWNESMHYDVWADICYEEVLDSPVGGVFSFEISPQKLADCPHEKEQMFRPVSFREATLETIFAPGSFVRYGNAGTAVRITLPANCGR